MLRDASQSLEHAPLYPLLSHKTAWKAIVEEFQLSPQQARIVRLVLRGKQVKEIAHDLNIKPATVQTYLGRIYVRNNVEDRLQLVLKIFGAAWQFKLSQSDDSKEA